MYADCSMSYSQSGTRDIAAVQRPVSRLAGRCCIVSCNEGDLPSDRLFINHKQIKLMMGSSL